MAASPVGLPPVPLLPVEIKFVITEPDQIGWIEIAARHAAHDRGQALQL